MTRSRAHSGFTLLELMLVMVLACMAMAIVAPSVSNWSRGGKLRDAADQFVAVARLARTQAVANSTTYRMTVDPSSGTYQLSMQSGTDFVGLGSSWGRAFTLPDGVHIQVMRQQQPAAQQQQQSQSGYGQSGPTQGNNAAAATATDNTIDFYPTGRTQQVQVRLSSDRGDVLDIQCPSPAEGFVVLPPGSAS
jgi:type II secretion system protein H